MSQAPSRAVNKILSLESSVDKYLKQHTGKKLVLAFSGGLDSTVLLHLLKEDTHPNTSTCFRVIHINHQLQSDSDRWEDHCQKITQKWNVSFQAFRIEVPKGNLENEARIVRYKTLFQNLNEDELLITAHHATDQAETFLMNALRQSGLRGLRGMFNERIVGRPLLLIPQQMLNQYAKKHQLPFIEDPMNENQNSTRVFLRKKVLPILQEHWKNADVQLAQTTMQLQENWSQQIELAQMILKEQAQLSINSIEGYSSSTQEFLIREWIREKNITPPSKKQIAEFVRQLSSHQDRHPTLYLGKNNILLRYNNQLHCISTARQVFSKMEWNPSNGPLTLPTKQILQERTATPSDAVYTIHWRNTLTNECEITQKWLKTQWKNWNIPPILRDQIPLLFRQNLLICVPGHFENKSIPKELKKSFELINEPC